ncbi:metalloregulator ArsR/SmtB family transcription factor [Bifidobacterium sp. ESL0763]|uniref:ArsR/SmtB family transcription factor n=1 Tax=Bifidobacterium sp. ESL0763 TaxID=2983227 RepID=UPI0023F9D8A9|nr:metalloregulator ArsR/SmtB family transcription factor [Bifidobacterium sp. ESL0763]MDF7663951.1 metalloregulator ArsR/SmtB family transcription factor [Bifidobacterium sp. ESL0763]
MRDQLHTDPKDVTITQALSALGDPLRLRIVALLDANGEMPCGDIYRALGITKTAASHHFKVLRGAGLVWRDHHGVKQSARLRRAEFDEAFPGLLDAVLRKARGEAGSRSEV